MIFIHLLASGKPGHIELMYKKVFKELNHARFPFLYYILYMHIICIVLCIIYTLYIYTLYIYIFIQFHAIGIAVSIEKRKANQSLRF